MRHRTHEGAYCFCDEESIFAVSRIPVTPIEDSDCAFSDGWERLEETDETTFVIKLLCVHFS